MAKALILSDEALAAPLDQPRAAQPDKAAAPAPEPVKVAKAPQVPLQIRIPAEDAKAIKRAALEADMTISDFLLSCFHAKMNP